MLLSHVSHTPLPDIWRMTYRQISAYAGAMAEVMKITSPWPSGEKEKPISNPATIDFLARSVGLMPRKGPA
jgi:hypothetical protein